MSLRDQLEDVRAKYGALTPELVVNEARDEESPLHGRFEWNDAVAGEAYRREQAHRLIRSVRVAYRKPTADAETRIRYYHAVPAESGYAYEPAEEIARDPIKSALLLRQMERDWRDLKARYAEFEEFAQLVLAELSAAAA